METRDIVNAPEVKKTIVERSQRRKDDPEITQWFEKKFFEYVIKQFNPVFHVNSVSAWKICQLPQPIPTWFLNKLEQQPEHQMLYVDPLHEQILELEKPILEFFNSRLKSNLKGKFMKMTYEQVLEAWHKDHEAMKKRLEKGQWDSSEQAIDEVLTVNTGKFIEITATGMLLRKEMAFESRYMQHCLGQFSNLIELKDGYGEYYVTQKEQGIFRYFSLRDSSNKPHVTISLEWDGEAWCIEQIKGKQNQAPVKKYADDVLLFLNHIQPNNNHNPDCLSMGIVYQPEINEDLTNNVNQALYFYFNELDDPCKIETLLMKNHHLLEQYDHQTNVIQHLLLGLNRPEHIRHPSEKYIEEILAYTNQKQTEKKFDLKVELSQAKSKKSLWSVIFKPYFWLLQTLYGLSKIPLLGWMIKIIVYIIALPWMLLNLKQDNRKQWMLATGDLIYFRNHIQWYQVDSLTLAHFEKHPEIYKNHLNQLLNIKQKKAGSKEKQIRYFLNQYFQIAQLENLYSSSEFGTASYLRDILVFSHIQKIFTIRLLVHFYELQEYDAWQYIVASSNIIQDCCSSWQDMGEKYVAGRELYLMFKHSDFENYDRSAKQDLHLYQSIYPNNWSLYSWNIDLFSTHNKNKVAE